VNPEARSTAQSSSDLDAACRRVEQTMLNSTMQLARLVDVEHAITLAHERMASSLDAAGRPHAADRQRLAATRWQRLSDRLQERVQHPPEAVGNLLGLSLGDRSAAEPVPCPVCGSADAVACAGGQMVCQDCGQLSHVVARTQACPAHRWVAARGEWDDIVEEHCAECGEVRLVASTR
jgi:hypothetical protein